MTARRWLLLVVAAAAVLLLVGRVLAGAYADYLWYDSLGAASLWRVRFSALSALRASCALVATVFAFANLYAVRASIVSLVFPRRVGNLEIGEEVPGRRMLGAALGLSLLLGIALSFTQNDWTSFALAGNGAPFGETDPYVGADLGFFVYWLPFESTLWNWTFVTVIVVTGLIVLLYALTPSLRFERGSLYLSTYVRRHFTVLLGVMLLLLAWSFRLDMYGLLSNGSGPDGAFTFVDHRVGVPANLILSLVTLAAGILVIWAGFAGQLKFASAAVLGTVVIALIGREVVPGIANHWGTEPERTARERPYLATRAGYTRRAFAVDRVRTRDSSVAFASLAAARPWIPMWDAPALSRVIGTAGSGPRLSWHASPNGIVAEQLRTLSAQEVTHPSWSLTSVLGWAADEHGAPVRVDAGGGPGLDESLIEPPLIRPGAPSFTVVADSLNRVAGTPLSGTLTRVAYAWSLQNLRLLFSELPQPRPTIVTRRDVGDRVERILPFFTQGRRIEPIVLGDTVYWCVDLYSASSTYPLSRHATLAGDERSYFQHAAVAFVQGSTGELYVVPDSSLDPIAATWVKRLPSLFSTWSALPPELARRVPPPIDGVYAQALAFGRYGTRAGTDVTMRLPVADGADGSVAGDELPFVEPDTQTLAIALPMVDEYDRLRGVFVGQGGPGGESVWLARNGSEQSWTTILDRLRALDSAGSAARDGPVARGRVRVVPLQHGVAYIQPVYRWRSESPPSLIRAAVMSGDSLWAENPPVPSLRGTSVPGAGRDLRASATALYAAMRAALRSGDWAAFGRAFDQLGRLLGSKAAGAGRTP